MKSCFGVHSIVVGIFAALASTTSCHAYFPRNESTYLNFHIPQELHHNHSWPHITSSFGRLGHGAEGSLTLPVKMLHRKNQQLCEDNLSEVTVMHSLDIPADEGAPFILLVERGVCTFVKKVRNAQHLGAAAVLIADTEHDHLPFESTKDILFLDDDPHPTPDDHNHSQHENEYRLADDGSGKDISIPSMMIAKKEYLGIRKVIDSGANSTGIVLGQLAWHTPKYDWKVSMELFSSPADWHTKQFIASNFSAIARTFDLNEMHGNTHDNDSYNERMNLMRFREHPILLDGQQLGCVGNTKAPDEPCYHLCTNGGRYCHANQHHGTFGKDIVEESLRRLCITRHYKSAKVYWDYIDHFNNFCWEADYFGVEKCIDDAYKHSNIDKNIINSCFTDSGDPSEDKTNAMLEAAIELTRKRGIYQSPTVMINHEPSLMVEFQGLSPRSVLLALCESFSYGKKPHVCYACMMCGDPVVCAKRSPMKCLAGDGKEEEDTDAHKEDDNTKKDKKHHGKHRVLRWFFALFLVGGCLGGYVYYKKRTEENGGDGYGSYSLQDAFLSNNS